VRSVATCSASVRAGSAQRVKAQRTLVSAKVSIRCRRWGKGHAGWWGCMAAKVVGGVRRPCGSGQAGSGMAMAAAVKAPKRLL